MRLSIKVIPCVTLREAKRDIVYSSAHLWLDYWPLFDLRRHGVSSMEVPMMKYLKLIIPYPQLY